MTAAGWTNALILSELCDKPVISESTENSENFESLDILPGTPER